MTAEEIPGPKAAVGNADGAASMEITFLKQEGRNTHLAASIATSAPT
jgi:hypothetical protein